MALIPLESNPDVLNKFIHLLGVPEKFNVIDVYGLDEDSLAYIPQPALALILLFPLSDKYQEFAKAEKEKIAEKRQDISSNVFFMKQFVSNACGTIALIHSIANNTDKIELNEGVLKNWFKDLFEIKSPEERGKMLSEASENSEAFKIITAHQELAKEGQTEVNPNDQVNHHFVALVARDGQLYELDGRKDFPVVHGSTSPETFLVDAAKVCKAFIARDAEDINFTVMALVSGENS